MSSLFFFHLNVTGDNVLSMMHSNATSLFGFAFLSRSCEINVIGQSVKEIENERREFIKKT